MDDALIVNLFDSSPEDAMDALSEKYARLCRRIAGNILTDPRDVEECVNDSLLEIWKRFPADRPEQLTAYVCRIARHIALNRLEYNRAAKRAGELLPLDEYAEAFPDESLRPDTDGRELGRIINRYLREQKPDRAKPTGENARRASGDFEERGLRLWKIRLGTLWTIWTTTF